MARPVKRTGKGNMQPLDRDKCLKRFYKFFAESGRVMESVEKSNFSYSTFQVWRKEDPSITERMHELEELYQDRLEAEVDRRALEGYDETTIVDCEKNGRSVKTIRKFSDQLLALKLKSRIARYRDRVEVSGEVKGQILVVPALTNPKNFAELVQEQKKLMEEE